ncbi:uncharacterized protein LOC144134255 [Amblyomma americanum]
MPRMKMLARAYVWWPFLDKDIEETVRNCQVCQSTRPAKSAGPLQPWRYPTKIWERIHADYAVKDSVNLLVVVDAYSKWIEVFGMTSTTTARTLEKLDTLFAAYGYPEEVVTDNGPQFTSDEFEQFMRHRDIKHTRTPPYHAASNGAAERLVRTTKEALLKQVLHDKNERVPGSDNRSAEPTFSKKRSNSGDLFRAKGVRRPTDSSGPATKTTTGPTSSGTTFAAELTQAILRYRQTSHRRATTYDPHTNGLTERVIKIIADILAIYVDTERKTGDVILPYIVFVYSAAGQETAKMTPFTDVHSREVTTRLDAMLSNGTE